MKISSQILEVMNYIHSQRITHGDFNLTNIMIDPQTLEIQLIDFGLAKFGVKEQDVHTSQGNLKYRAPNEEIFQNAYRADLWGLHLVLMSVFSQQKVTSKKAGSLFKKIKSLNQDYSRECLQALSYLFENFDMMINGEKPNIVKLRGFHQINV